MKRIQTALAACACTALAALLFAASTAESGELTSRTIVTAAAADVTWGS
ncbi:hypothetical protein [Streptomyces spectabilis]|uniref:Uncharacterized protein n=1 Tax=Streptomyces spectabilis TaxID=68270 RepID=A0A7W8B490_STRST|nr:hypothetical protein [Streptomyces spectabilis]